MATKYDTIVKELDLKVERIIKLYISSRQRCEDLEAEVAALKTELEQAQREKQDLKEKLNTSQVANALSNNGDSREAKQRISQLVREIDKCIALLNN